MSFYLQIDGQGNGGQSFRVDGGKNVRCFKIGSESNFEIAESTMVTLIGLNITNGLAADVRLPGVIC